MLGRYVGWSLAVSQVACYFQMPAWYKRLPTPVKNAV